MVRIYILHVKQRRHLLAICRFHGNNEIKEGGRYTTSMEIDEILYFLARLDINEVETGDKGEYRAIAKNKYGSGTATINLNFEGDGKPK